LPILQHKDSDLYNNYKYMKQNHDIYVGNTTKTKDTSMVGINICQHDQTDSIKTVSSD